MAELCLVASHGYRSGFFFHPAEQQSLGKIFKDYQPLMFNPGWSQDSRQPWLYRPALHLAESPLKPSISMLDGNEIFKHDSTTRRSVVNEVQDFHPNSVLLSYGIAKQCALREKVLKLLMSGGSETEGSAIDLSVLFDLMGRQGPVMHWPQQPLPPYCGQAFLDTESQCPLITLCGEVCSEKPFLIGDLSHDSEFTYDMYYTDGLASLTGPRVELEDVFTTLSEVYSPKNSIKWKKQQMLVPYFDRRTKKVSRTDVTGPSPRLPLKSSEKVKNKASSKKKINVKAAKERDFYRNNSFHACESLLSVIVDKKQHGKNAVHSLRRFGPELPEVLMQFSASIAGTGLAVLFSVVCKVACSRVPFCASKLLNTGLGIGLVWLSWAVNKLRDTVISINKNPDGIDVREEEIVSKLDRSVKEIYFRAGAILAVAVLRFA